MARQTFLTFAFSVGIAALTTASPLLAAETVDKGTLPSGNVQVIGRFSNAQPSGIAVLPDGRLVLGFPRSAHEHSGPRLGLYTKGKLTPFPDAAAQEQFVSPLGMTIDTNGQLWVLDEGMVAGTGTVAGAQKLFRIDPASGKIAQVIPLSAPALLPDSHVNDVRIDLTHGKAGTAFITDTSVDVHPALIVVDLATGHQRRILADTVSVMPVPGFVAVMDGVAGRYDPAHATIPQGGVNGIALSPDQQTLYWQPQSSRRLYSAPTAVLSDSNTSEANLEKAVKDEGETGVGDGIATGPDGSLYITDDERHAILRHRPDGQVSVVAHDPRLTEPDGLTYANGALYGTVGQWARLPVFHNGKDLEVMPYIVVKIAPLN
ncbi:SMP-30/gluconolactonase/LRE family protein [Gluconobacter kondonii]|uniref:Gluconolactonase n=1 Tax=Gluconobacter kondonii TaxID=941463 RepID=A0ABQ5WS99_9PROT|nr:L-dopachrome tautomerase-related protein [Gluconobacter kondonii]MCP1237221.1 SMP-30/gluconolactonase/LRE family protein [Gluconobacter kondonii]GBR34565.1 gluconolactonase [Gluconobacter kondonii NBRC 3266]GLQ66375.1 gluconolactonase [Gluconobacter kondonii]